MVEPQRLSIGLSQRWTHGNTSPAPAPKPAAQAEAPPGSSSSAAVDVAEGIRAFRSLWPNGRKASGPATPEGAAAIAVHADAASATSVGAAQRATEAPLLDNVKVHVAAITVDSRAAAEQLQPKKESEAAKKRLTAGSGAAICTRTTDVNTKKSPLDTAARYCLISHTRKGPHSCKACGTCDYAYSTVRDMCDCPQLGVEHLMK